MLAALETESTAAEVAAKIGMPLHLVRSGLRDMVAAGLVSEADERFRQTEKGAAVATQGRR
jgi:predicted transcriptional regulator